MRIGGMRALVAAFVSLVLFASCAVPLGSGAATPRSVGTSAPSPTDTAPSAGRTAPSATAAGASPTAARPAFLSYSFTDVRDGKQFTLSDFRGKQVFVIGMAVW